MRNLETAMAEVRVTWEDIVRRTIYTTMPTESETITSGIEEVTVSGRASWVASGGADGRRDGGVFVPRSSHSNPPVLVSNHGGLREFGRYARGM